MSFGNVPRDLIVSCFATTRSVAAKSINALFAADLRTVGALVQYQRSPGVWVTAESLTVPATQLGNMYTPVAAVPANNLALSYDGGVLAVGLSAANYGDSVLEIWTNLDGGGQYVPTAAPILPPGSTIAPATQGIVSINNDGTIIALGIFDDNTNIGAVYIYAFDGTNWNLQGSKITGLGEVGAGYFGFMVSLNGAGNLLAVGCPEEGANNEGAVYIYNLSVITAPVLVQKINGTILSGEFGWNVKFSADGSTLAVGAPSIITTNVPGSVFIYTKIQGIWTQQATFTEAPDQDGFGYKVSLSGDGNILAVSSISYLKMYYRTPGYVGQSAWSTGALIPLPYDLVDPIRVAGFVPSLSQDGNTLCFSDEQNVNIIGASWSYTQGPLGTWTQNGPGFVGTGGAGINQGKIALSGDGKVAAVLDNAAEFWVFV
jgi:hypothetical protein